MFFVCLFVLEFVLIVVYFFKCDDCGHVLTVSIHPSWMIGRWSRSIFVDCLVFCQLVNTHQSHLHTKHFACQSMTATKWPTAILLTNWKKNYLMEAILFHVFLHNVTFLTNKKHLVVVFVVDHVTLSIQYLIFICHSFFTAAAAVHSHTTDWIFLFFFHFSTYKTKKKRKQNKFSYANSPFGSLVCFRIPFFIDWSFSIVPKDGSQKWNS